MMSWAIDVFPGEFVPIVRTKLRIATRASSEDAIYRAALLCTLWIHRSEADPWQDVGPICYVRPDIGKRLLDQLEGIHPDTSYLSRLSDRSLGEMYVWIMRTYGLEDQQLGFGQVGPGIGLRVVRENTFAALKERGNMKVFDYVVLSLPEQRWLRSQRANVEEAYFRRQWKAVGPRQLLKYVAGRNIKWYAGEAGVLAGVLLGGALALPFSLLFGPAHNIMLRSALCAVAVIAYTLGIWRIVFLTSANRRTLRAF
jgi:hypothetical protein